VERLERLTDEHIRALFVAARVESIGTAPTWTEPGSARVFKGLDAWVAAFKYKRAQLALVRCGKG
jgi:hypothetical protein